MLRPGLSLLVELLGIPQEFRWHAIRPLCPSIVKLLQGFLDLILMEGFIHAISSINREIWIRRLWQVGASGAATICKGLDVCIPLLYLLQRKRELTVLAPQEPPK